MANNYDKGIDELYFFHDNPHLKEMTIKEIHEYMLGYPDHDSKKKEKESQIKSFSQ